MNKKNETNDANEDFLYLTLKVYPNANKSEWLGLEQGTNYMKVRIKAAPVDGKANKAVVKFLADLFGVVQKSVEQISGNTQKIKRFKIYKPKFFPKDVSRDVSRIQ